MQAICAKVFHRDVFMPEVISTALKGRWLTLSYGWHAQQEMLDKYCVINNPPNKIKVENPVEVTVEALAGKKQITKLVVRQKYNSELDIVLVIKPEFALGRGFVKTVWINKATDLHKTLDKSKFATKL